MNIKSTNQQQQQQQQNRVSACVLFVFVCLTAEEYIQISVEKNSPLGNWFWSNKWDFISFHFEFSFTFNITRCINHSQWFGTSIFGEAFAEGRVEHERQRDVLVDLFCIVCVHIGCCCCCGCCCGCLFRTLSSANTRSDIKRIKKTSTICMFFRLKLYYIYIGKLSA